MEAKTRCVGRRFCQVVGRRQKPKQRATSSETRENTNPIAVETCHSPYSIHQAGYLPLLSHSPYFLKLANSPPITPIHLTPQAGYPSFPFIHQAFYLPSLTSPKLAASHPLPPQAIYLPSPYFPKLASSDSPCSPRWLPPIPHDPQAGYLPFLTHPSWLPRIPLTPPNWLPPTPAGYPIPISTPKLASPHHLLTADSNHHFPFPPTYYQFPFSSKLGISHPFPPPSCRPST